ncbi:hypothetical protein DFH09DRAFT_1087469 [Mycena vulgaris]|nr:hypothetical protein DFH09DRAFT_1087469 [Mycena vulgaris]
MRSVEHGADAANGCAPPAAIASERDSHIGFVLRLESDHVPSASQAQKMCREKGTYQESGLFRKPRTGRGCLKEDICILRRQSGNGKAIVSTLKAGYRYLNKISKSEKRPKYSCTYRYSGAGSEDESRGHRGKQITPDEVISWECFSSHYI